MYTHTFELPLYVEPSQHFKRFLKDLGNPLSKQCMVSYWQDQEKLTFSSKELDENEHKASVVPISFDLPANKRRQVERNVSSFASKFNSSMALRGNDLEIVMELISDISQEDANHYDKNVKAVLRLTIFSKSLAKKIALESFFTVIDSSVR